MTEVESRDQKQPQREGYAAKPQNVLELCDEAQRQKKFERRKKLKQVTLMMFRRWIEKSPDQMRATSMSSKLLKMMIEFC